MFGKDDDEDTEYKCFIRNWWRYDPRSGYPNGLVPDPGADKHYIDGTYTRAEAIEKCDEYNDSHPPGMLSRKMEFESI